MCSTKTAPGEATTVAWGIFRGLPWDLPCRQAGQKIPRILLPDQWDTILSTIMRAGNFHEKRISGLLNREVTAPFIRHMSEAFPSWIQLRKCVKLKQENTVSALFSGVLTVESGECALISAKVRTLKRVRIMNLTLDGLKQAIQSPACEECRNWHQMQKFIKWNNYRGHYTGNSPATDETGKN